jgi:hypothetical protein
LLAAALCLIGATLGLPGSASAAEPSEPGLAVVYTFGEFNDVEEVVERTDNGNPNPGKPILTLDNRGGEGAKVLSANHPKLVGARLSGFVKFPEAGTYQIAMRTNDGTRVVLDGVTILEDPKPHGDQDEGPVSVDIAEPGWHPITVYFYQKKGSWILRVSWSGPGLPEMAPIGAEYLAH